MGPVQVEVARTLAQRHDRADCARFYWQSADDVARHARLPRRRVVHCLERFAAAGLIDRNDDDGWISYRMHLSFAETLYAVPRSQ